MASQIINIGTVADDGTGDDLRNCFYKLNNNIFNYITKAVDYTLLETDYLVECTDTLELTLPTAEGLNSKMYLIKNTGTSKTITITPDGSETIDGASSKVITADNGFVKLYSNNAQWLIIAD